MSLKVLALSQSLSAGGGAEKFLANLTLGLREQVDFTLVVPVIRDSGRQVFPYHGRLIELEMEWGHEHGSSALRIFRLLRRLRRLSGVIKSEKPDLILSNFSYSWHLLVLLLKLFKLIRQPLILRFGSSLDHQLENRDRLYGWFLSRLIQKADHFVANSQGLTQKLIARFHLDPQKCSTIYNPVPVSRVVALADATNEKVEEDELVLVHAGRLAPEKNQELLLRVFGRLRRVLNANLWIIGSGPCEESLKDLAQQLNLTAAIRFWGWRENPYPLVRCADVFVLTSNYEGFPNILVEAMALGCPVVSTDCRYGPSEILEDGAWGLLTPVGDEESLYQALLRILSDKNLREQYAQKSIERSRRYSEEKILPRYYELFVSLVRAQVS